MKSGLNRPAALIALFAITLSMLSVHAADSVEDRLEKVEALKRTDHVGFVAELDALERDRSQLTHHQRELVDYLRGWQATFEGNYEVAIERLERLSADAKDEVIRFRSRSTLINALSLARKHTESFEQLIRLMEDLPGQTDPGARAQALGVSAQLHNVVGQHDESIRLSALLVSESDLPWVRCGAATVQIDSEIKSGVRSDIGPSLERFIEDCSRNQEYLFAGALRVSSAKLHLANDRPMAALDALQPHEAEIQATRFPHLISDTAAQMARAHLAMGELNAAEKRAQEAIDLTQDGQNTGPLAEAWQVLAEVASQRGDYVTAFQALQRHAEVERANLDDIGQRALAFQLARYRTQAQKLEIESLNQQNELLKLQQEVTTTAVQNARLSILLLLTVLGFAVVWALRTRRMQRHFQQLAQSDSLTGAASRPHFMTHGRHLLEKAQRSGGQAALLIMDLDFFKTVNDEHGHAVGDEMLRRAADCCRETLAPHGLFGRLGGEEFGFILPGRSATEAIELADACRQAVHTIYYGPPEQPSRLSASFGVTSTTEEGFDLRDLLVAADGALYEAKRKGRNRVVHQPRRRSEPAAGTPAAV